MAGFPSLRLRRLRRTPSSRALVRETRLTADRFVAPLFVRKGRRLREPIASLPGVSRVSPDEAAAEAQAFRSLGIPAVILFGLPERKDETGSEAWDDDGAVQHGIREIRRAAPDILIVTDVCLDEYTSHGHCGVIRDGEVDNDATLPLLARAALSHARAGADVVAPSDMMDGRVAAIRAGLDGAGFTEAAILSYAAKSASAFYGPFREAADSAPKFGDRRGYQMDGANRREALLPLNAPEDVDWRYRQGYYDGERALAPGVKEATLDAQLRRALLALTFGASNRPVTGFARSLDVRRWLDSGGSVLLVWEKPTAAEAAYDPLPTKYTGLTMIRYFQGPAK